jgi:hypothetical protein
MTYHLLAAITGGVAMGLWFDRIVEMARSPAILGAGVIGLATCLAAGQEWAGLALGCLLGARVMAGWQARR